MTALATVLGCENLLPVFLAALAAVLGFSGIFIWLNRDVATEAAAVAVGWSMAGYVLLAITASRWSCDQYPIFAGVLVGDIASLGGLITFVRRQRPAWDDGDVLERPPTGPEPLPPASGVRAHKIRPVVNRLPGSRRRTYITPHPIRRR